MVDNTNMQTKMVNACAFVVLIMNLEKTKVIKGSNKDT